MVEMNVKREEYAKLGNIISFFIFSPVSGFYKTSSGFGAMGLEHTFSILHIYLRFSQPLNGGFICPKRLEAEAKPP